MLFIVLLLLRVDIIDYDSPVLVVGISHLSVRVLESIDATSYMRFVFSSYFVCWVS